jgi:hypothetical protein
MRTAISKTIVFPAGGTRTRSRSGEFVETPATTESRTRLIRLHDRFKGPIDALGARVNRPTGDPKPLDEITEN